MRVAQSYLVDSHVGPRKRSAYNYLTLPSYCTVADEKLCLSNNHYSDPPAPADSIGIVIMLARFSITLSAVLLSSPHCALIFKNKPEP